MKTKTIQINGTNVSCSHESKHDPKTGLTHIQLTVEVGDIKTIHNMHIGPNGKAVPAAYGQAEIQADFEKFRLDCATEAESKNRVKTFAESVE
jgi:hypothetical protein